MFKSSFSGRKRFRGRRTDVTGEGGARPDPTAGLPLAAGCSQMIFSCWMRDGNQPGISLSPRCPRSPSQGSRAATGAELQGTSPRPRGAGPNVGRGRRSSSNIALHLPHGGPHEPCISSRQLPDPCRALPVPRGARNEGRKGKASLGAQLQFTFLLAGNCHGNSSGTERDCMTSQCNAPGGCPGKGPSSWVQVGHRQNAQK